MHHRTLLLPGLLVASLLATACNADEVTVDPVEATTTDDETSSEETDTAAGEDPADATAADDAVTPVATEEEPADEALSVRVAATPDPMAGVNLEVTTTGFAWAPEHASGDVVDGEGHAHLYVDGEKVGRLYTPWFHLGGLEPGEHEIEVTLNGNDHSDLEVDGEVVAATTTVTVPETAGSAGGHHDDHEAAAPMTVEVTATPDAEMGVNLHVTTTGFTWAPERASSMHVDGEGHAHVYVDGEKLGRLYGEWMHLNLDPGEHEVEVTLNANDHADYLVGGEVAAASVVVDVAAGDAGH